MRIVLLEEKKWTSGELNENLIGKNGAAGQLMNKCPYFIFLPKEKSKQSNGPVYQTGFFQSPKCLS